MGPLRERERAPAGASAPEREILWGGAGGGAYRGQPRHLGPVAVSGLVRGVVASLPPGVFLAVLVGYREFQGSGTLVVAMGLALVVGIGAALGVGDALADEKQRFRVAWRMAGASVAPLAGGIPVKALELASQGHTFLDLDPDSLLEMLFTTGVGCVFCGLVGGLVLQGLANLEAATPARTRLARTAIVTGVVRLFTAEIWPTSSVVWAIAHVVLAGCLLYLGLDLGERAARAVERKLG